MQTAAVRVMVGDFAIVFVRYRFHKYRTMPAASIPIMNPTSSGMKLTREAATTPKTGHAISVITMCVGIFFILFLQ